MRRSYRSTSGSHSVPGAGHRDSGLQGNRRHEFVAVEPNLWVALVVSLALHGAVLSLLAGSREPRRLGTISIALYGGAGNGGLEGPGDGRSLGDGGGQRGTPEEGRGEESLEPVVSKPPQPEPTARESDSSRPRAQPQPSDAQPAKSRTRVGRTDAAPRGDDAAAKASARAAEKERKGGADPQVEETSAARRSGTEPPGAGRAVASRGGLGTGDGEIGYGVSGGAEGGGKTGGGSDLQASCVACPVPSYPRRARRRGWEGIVDLRLRIDGAGRVSTVTVARSSGFGVLDDAAATAARRSRFQLRSRQGMSGAVWGRMRYRFELGGG